MPNPDEFFPAYGEMESRLRHLESWASLFSGRRVSDDAVSDQAAAFAGHNQDAGGGGLLGGDVVGPLGSTKVVKLRNKALTGTEANGYVYAYDGTQWVAQDYVAANWGVGLATNPTHRFQVSSDSLDKVTSWFQGTSDSLALGSRGWHVSKDKTQTFETTWAWHSDGAPVWEIGMAGDTNNAHNFGFGAADFLFYDTTAASNSGGITARVSYEQAATNGVASKWLFGRNLTTSPRASTAFFEVRNPSAVLTALRVRGATAQTANSVAVEDVDGNALLAVDPAGNARWWALSSTVTLRQQSALDNTWIDSTDASRKARLVLSVYDTAAREALRLDTDGSRALVGLGGTTPTARLHLPAGTATASTAPLKLTSGTNLTTPEAGAVEYDGTEYYASIGSIRYALLRSTFTEGQNVALGTTTGTQWGTAGGAAGQKQGWWGVTPIVQPLLATGAGATVDNVITTLQNLGLCRQA